MDGENAIQKQMQSALSTAITQYGPGALNVFLLMLAPLFPALLAVRGSLLLMMSIAGVRKGDQMHQRIRRIEDHLEEAGVRLEVLEDAAQHVQAGHQPPALSAMGLTSRDVRNALEAWAEAMSADDDRMVRAWALVTVHILQGQMRSQLDLAALRVLPFITPETLVFLRDNEALWSCDGLTNEFLDPLVSLGLIETALTPHRPRTKKSNRARLTEVGRAVLRITATP